MRHADKSFQAAQRLIDADTLDDPSRVVAVFDAQGALVHVSTRFSELTGMSKEESRGQGYLLCVHPEDVLTVMTSCSAAVNQRRGIGAYYRLVHRDTKQIIHMIALAQPLFDEKNRFNGIILRCAELINKPTYEQIHQTSTPLVAALDMNLYFTSLNGAAATILGPPENVIGHCVMEFVHPDDVDIALNGLYDVVASHEPIGPVTVRMFDFTGAIRYIEVFARNLSELAMVGGILIDARDVTEQVVAARALAEQLQRQAQILEQLNEGVWVIDDQGITTYANPALCAMLNVSATELLGHSCLNFIDPAHHWVATAGFASFVETAKERFALVLSPKNAPPLVTEATLSSLFEGGFVATVADVSARIHAHEATVLAHSAVDYANQLKATLLSRVSHELRTPLHAILGYSELLRTNLPVEAECYLNQLDTATTHLRALIDDVLDITTLDADSLALDLRPVSSAEIINDAIVLATPLATPQRTEVISIARDNPTILTDRQRLAQALTNLLANAIKYSPPFSTITVNCVASGGNVEFRVTDAGPGVAPEEAQAIFQPFYRGRAGKSAPGSGLGLTVVASIASALGANVRVAGNTFVVSLPLPLALTGETTPTSQEPPELSPKSVVLQIEDDPVTALLLAQVIGSSCDLELHQAATAHSGQELLLSLPVDVLVLDLSLPDGSGQEILSTLRSSAEFRDLPVIVTTADARRSTEAELRRLGVQGYLVKPFSLHDLPDQIRTLVEKTKAATGATV